MLGSNAVFYYHQYLVAPGRVSDARQYPAGQRTAPEGPFWVERRGSLAVAGTAVIGADLAVRHGIGEGRQSTQLSRSRRLS